METGALMARICVVQGTNRLPVPVHNWSQRFINLRMKHQTKVMASALGIRIANTASLFIKCYPHPGEIMQIAMNVHSD